MNTPIYNGLAQSDVDFGGFDALNVGNWPTGGGGGGGGGGLDDPNTVTSTDIGLVGDGVTDNTTALQTWFNSVAAAAVSATLIVEDGVYIFSGPLQDTGARNAQILLPINYPKYFTLTIKGRQAIPTWTSDASVDSAFPLPLGARFKSTLATGGGTRPSFIGGHGTVANQNPIHLCIENMMFQTVANPLISCMNLSTITWVDMTRDVLFIAGDHLDGPHITQPTQANSYGLILPATNLGVLHTIENVHVFGFYNGIRFGEIVHVNNAGIYFCKTALDFQYAFHPNIIERVLLFHNTNGITVSPSDDGTVAAGCAIAIEQLDIEHENPVGPWYTTVYDINDPGNIATGDITWWVVKGGVGIDTTFTANGGTGIQYRRMGSDTHAGPVYIGTDARLTAISGGTKLETRNTGTGVWVESARWTNP